MRFDLAVDPIDLMVLVGYLLAVVLFGLWVGRGQRDMTDYLLGGRDLPWWAILGSIVATETSTVTFLSIPGLAYNPENGNLCFLQLALGMLVGRWLIVHLLLPQYFRGKLFTAYEVLHRRFGGPTKDLASILFLVARNVGDGLRLFLTAIVLEKVIGMPLPVCVVLVGVLTIGYTFLGGIKSVVWNDCIQFVVYVGGGILTLGVIVYSLPGGWPELWEFAAAHDKLQVFDMRWNLSTNYTFWSGLIGGAFLALGTHGVDQMMVQRYLCARTEREAGRALITSGFVVLAQFALFLFLGVALACYYSRVAPGQAFASGDHVLATFIVEELPVGVGLIGVILAAVFSAAMSTLSSSLNSSASSAVNDLYLPRRRQPPTEREQLWISRLFTVLFGLVQIGVGIGGLWLSDVVVNNVLAIAGFTVGVLLGVFALGVFTERVGQAAAVAGLACGLLVLGFVKFGVPLVVPRLSVAWPWFALIGATVTFAAGWVASGIWPRAAKEIS